MEIRDEHDAFNSIIAGLEIAANGAQEMSKYRPELRDIWLKLAETYTVCKHTVYKLAEERASKVIKS